MTHKPDTLLARYHTQLAFIFFRAGGERRKGKGKGVKKCWIRVQKWKLDFCRWSVNLFIWKIYSDTIRPVQARIRVKQCFIFYFVLGKFQFTILMQYQVVIIKGGHQWCFQWRNSDVTWANQCKWRWWCWWYK